MILDNVVPYSVFRKHLANKYAKQCEKYILKGGTLPVTTKEIILAYIEREEL